MKYSDKTNQYNTVDLQLPNSELSKLRSRIRTGTDVSLNLASNAAGKSNIKTHFSDKLLSINTQASNILEAFTNGSSANIKSSTT